MEIIEHGSTYKSIICKSCDCKFNYSANDIKTALWSEDYYKYIQCPECGKIYNLSKYY